MASYKEQNRERLVRLLDQAAYARARSSSRQLAPLRHGRQALAHFLAGGRPSLRCIAPRYRSAIGESRQERAHRPPACSLDELHALPFLCVVAITPGDESHEHEAKIAAAVGTY